MTGRVIRLPMRCNPPGFSLLASVAGLMVALGSASASAQQAGHGAQKAMFATKAEAEAAAKTFHCTGAHKMGDQWMPCANHVETTGSHSSPSAH